MLAHRAMVSSIPRLQSRAVSGSMALQQPESDLVFMAPATTKDCADA